MRKRKAGARQIRPHVGGVPDKCCKGVRNRGKIKSRHLPRKDAVKNYAIKKPRAQSARCGHGENNRGVSIHAPTGGATFASPISGSPSAFQFTRPRGARRRIADRRLPVLCFNSRAHGGRDQERIDKAIKEAFQFTRPLGARQTFCRTARRHACFNSRAHGGRDCAHLPPRPAPPWFQFTRPRGARLSPLLSLCAARSFQFTRPRGARPWVVPTFSVNKKELVSIHAPTGGAT